MHPFVDQETYSIELRNGFIQIYKWAVNNSLCPSSFATKQVDLVPVLIRLKAGW